MKYMVRVFSILLILFLLVGFTIPAVALNTGFSTEEMSEADANHAIAVTSLSLLTEEPQLLYMTGFDVNETKIAIEQNGYDTQKTISVYSHDGQFLYGYAFESMGSYGVEWDGDNLNIYFVRGGLIISVDPTGKIIDVKDVPDTSENDAYYRNSMELTERTVNGTTYTIRKDKALTAFYSSLEATDQNGETRILFESETNEQKENGGLPFSKTKLFVFVIGIILFWTIVSGVGFYVLRRYLKKSKIEDPK